ncbi:AraC family transcriptional regulator [Prolixibacteraceae bacterium Z1-6]|uniref:AraC family transcriptional regulator n=1 Tax=Draconibacterium aestuarii TaxID=2998507 RepID=A0A9X3F7M1_9BACT|nr:AraC family transcriptional regulator [Prolixibacteraceae bacterium Z1-6]
MKIMHEQIDFPGRAAVKVKLQEKSHFTYPWHFHTEYELLYVMEGYGTRFIADNIEPFGVGDLVLLGSNLPHFWKSDSTFYGNEGTKKMKYVVIQFANEFFKEAISEYPEFHLIKELLERSIRGISFSKAFSRRVKPKIMKVVESKGFERALRTLELLQMLTASEDHRFLAGELYQIENYNFISDRMKKVMYYLNSTYLKKVELEKVAEVATLHPSAFCRYFKEKSGKSLSEFVNDMRVSYACRLIIEGKISVSQICYESGFNNLSNFNRIFKKHTGFTPTAYFQEFNKGQENHTIKV